MHISKKTSHLTSVLKNLNGMVIWPGGCNIYGHDPYTPDMSEKLVSLKMHKNISHDLICMEKVEE